VAAAGSRANRINAGATEFSTPLSGGAPNGTLQYAKSVDQSVLFDSRNGFADTFLFLLPGLEDDFWDELRFRRLRVSFYFDRLPLCFLDWLAMRCELFAKNVGS